MIKNIPNHVAIIMDGNGRWAKNLHKPRIYGHQKGADVISNIVLESIKNKIKVLSLFAFSLENWNRPKAEVSFLMKLILLKMNEKTIKWLNEHNVKFKWTGFEKNLTKSLINQIKNVEKQTIKNNGLILNICFNYGGVQDIEQASQKSKDKNDLSKHLLTYPLPPVDLLIRTGNEKRISNFLLFQSAYAEIIFEKTFWPAYNINVFNSNLIEYSNRNRRFGKVHE